MWVTVLLFGASGSAGGSVLVACLLSPDVTEVRAVTRRPLGLAHAKLIEVRHDDYASYAPIGNMFTGVDACFYCLGKSVRQVADAAEYRRLTYDFAMAAARTLAECSPDAVFHFISGQGARLDSRFMWARVKAETERDLVEQFDAVCWRPGMIDGVPSRSEPVGYKIFRPVGRVLLRPFKGLYVAGDDIGRAMIRATKQGVRGRIVENAEIRRLASEYSRLVGSGGA
jgi:uncharacterized protein YbjT (DUF2867 family)